MKAEVALGKKNLEQMVQDRLMTAVPCNFWTIEMSCFRGGPSNPAGGNHVQSPMLYIKVESHMLCLLLHCFMLI